uniref:Solute-binding protein family 3/N-terminal domain-containing protein n=1 Tax=Anopheles farauti TaxID=69004 RepID=A0A182QZL3_9DIPT
MNALPATIQPQSNHHPVRRNETYAPLPAAVDSTHPKPPVQVTIDSRTKPRPLPPRVENWMANFLRKPTRERVRWRSKLYELEPHWSTRPAPERADHLIDVGTEDFVNWLNGLGVERSTLTTDVVRELFSIGPADETSRALNIAPKEIRAVPEEVAKEWHLPQLALENRIAQQLDRDRMLAGVATKRTAFGRNLPHHLRCGWTPDASGSGDFARPDFPDDLMSLKRLFHDIWHLRSVKYLVDYLAMRPTLPKPRFLVEKGLFERQDALGVVPFYRKVLSQKAIAESIKRTIMGYPVGGRLVEVASSANFNSLFRPSLKGLPFRAIVTESKPYSYQSPENILTGLDVDVVRTIAHMLELNVRFTHLYNANYSDILKMLYNRHIDMYATRRGCNRGHQLLYLHERSNIRLLMPKSQRINFNLQFLKPFKPEVWYLLLVLLLAGGALNWWFRDRLPVNVLMVVVFDVGRDFHRQTAVLVVVIQLLKFILLEAYLGQVTSFMIRLRYQEDPQTLEQFFQSNIELNAPVVLNPFINQLPSDISVRVREKLRNPQTRNPNLEFEPGYAYMVTEYASDALKNEHSYGSIFNASFFYVMDEPLVEFDTCYLFATWSKFMGKFGECLERLYETGIMLKLTGDAWRLANKAPKSSPSTLLVFPDLVPVFFFLCYGWIVSVAFFADNTAVQLASGGLFFQPDLPDLRLAGAVGAVGMLF